MVRELHNNTDLNKSTGKSSKGGDPPVPQTVRQACALTHPGVGKPSSFSCYPLAGPTWVFWAGVGASPVLRSISCCILSASVWPRTSRSRGCSVPCPHPPLVFWGHLSPISVVITACSFSVLLSRCPHFFVGGSKNPKMILASLPATIFPEFLWETFEKPFFFDRNFSTALPSPFTCLLSFGLLGWVAWR